MGIEGTADERQRAERLVDASGVRSSVSIVPITDARERAAVLSGAHAAIQPAISDATALGALEALALGIPVVCSRAGSLPETVGSAGIVVEPRDPARMAAAIEAMWAGGSLAQQLRRQARRRAETKRRTWADVASDTRAAYSAAAATADA
jgi:glycosyltransferase involved in cell wall biosynthesis